MTKPILPSPRILVDLERLRHRHSGLGYYCHSLERGLREGATQGAQMQVDYYGQGYTKVFRSWHRLYNPIPRGYDILHITHQLQRYFLHSWRPRCGTVVTLHDLNFLYEKLSECQLRRRICRVGRILQQADVIVCISDFVRADLLAHRGLFRLRPGVRIKVIHNGIMFQPAPTVCSPEVAKLTEQDYLLCIGVLHHKKQQHLLIEMLPFLSPTTHLVLVYSEAREPYYSEVLATIDRLGLGERVHLLKGISEDDKLYLLQRAQAYVHPSIAEGFGIPPIEAMSMGRPTFVSRATSLPEICGPEAYYWDTPEPSAMAEVVIRGLADYTAQPDKGERLHRWAMRYDYRRMAEQYRAVYASLLTPPSEVL